MKKMSKKLLKAVEGLARREIIRNYDGWPPCNGIIHQPKRPETLKKN